MKKIILLTLAITLMVYNIKAQENNRDFRNKLQVGMKIGFNYSNVYDTQGEAFNTDPKIGLVAGGFLSIPIGKYLGFQPEILFSQKGFHATGRVLTIPYELTRTTNFIDVPLLFQLKPASFITLVAGPQFSFLLKQKDEFANTTQEEEFKNDNIRKNILCFLGGADLNLNHVVLGARVGWDIQNNNGDGTSTTPRYKNVWYQATIGFKF
jgi:hypothetical protein